MTRCCSTVETLSEIFVVQGDRFSGTYRVYLWWFMSFFGFIEEHVGQAFYQFILILVEGQLRASMKNDCNA